MQSTELEVAHATPATSDFTAQHDFRVQNNYTMGHTSSVDVTPRDSFGRNHDLLSSQASLSSISSSRSLSPSSSVNSMAALLCSRMAESVAGTLLDSLLSIPSTTSSFEASPSPSLAPSVCSSPSVIDFPRGGAAVIDENSLRVTVKSGNRFLANDGISDIGNVDEAIDEGSSSREYSGLSRYQRYKELCQSLQTLSHEEEYLHHHLPSHHHYISGHKHRSHRREKKADWHNYQDGVGHQRSNHRNHLRRHDSRHHSQYSRHHPPHHPPHHHLSDDENYVSTKKKPLQFQHQYTAMMALATPKDKVQGGAPRGGKMVVEEPPRDIPDSLRVDLRNSAASRHETEAPMSESPSTSSSASSASHRGSLHDTSDGDPSGLGLGGRGKYEAGVYGDDFLKTTTDGNTGGENPEPIRPQTTFLFQHSNTNYTFQRENDVIVKNQLHHHLQRMYTPTTSPGAGFFPITSHQSMSFHHYTSRMSQTFHADPDSFPSMRSRQIGLCIMLLTSILCNYDHGCIPSTLGEIQVERGIGYIEQSLLGSLVYFGLIIGTLIAGVAFHYVGAKWLIVSSLWSLCASLYIFSAADSLFLMYVSRFFSGLSQAAPVVFLPVWVDEFAPEGSLTRWMSFTQLAGIGGTVFGYFVGGMLSQMDLQSPPHQHDVVHSQQQQPQLEEVTSGNGLFSASSFSLSLSSSLLSVASPLLSSSLLSTSSPFSSSMSPLTLLSTEQFYGDGSDSGIASYGGGTGVDSAPTSSFGGNGGHQAPDVDGQYSISLLSNKGDGEDGIFSMISFIDLTSSISWRTPFLFQSLAIIPVVLILSFLPSKIINLMAEEELLEYDDLCCCDGTTDAENGAGEGRATQQHHQRRQRRRDSPISILDRENAPSFCIEMQEERKKMAEAPDGDDKKGDQKSQNIKPHAEGGRDAAVGGPADDIDSAVAAGNGYCAGVRDLLMNPIYLIITLGMSNLYFVVTGIQFWVTEYMMRVLHHQKIFVVTVSTFCFLTAPTSGVWFGGYIGDLYGGYRGSQQAKAIKVATVFAGLAATFACASTQLADIIFFSSSLWLSLFFGAALVPVGVGIILSCVHSHQRSLSSAVSQFAYNTFGWFAAPLLSGVVMDVVAVVGGDNIDDDTPLRIGFSIVLSLSVVGFLLFLSATFFEPTTVSEDEEDDAELQIELIRSRVPTLSF